MRFWASALSAASAAANASSRMTYTNALSLLLYFAMRSSMCVVNSTEEICFFRIASAAAAAVPKSGSNFVWSDAIAEKDAEASIPVMA